MDRQRKEFIELLRQVVDSGMQKKALSKRLGYGSDNMVYRFLRGDALPGKKKVRENIKALRKMVSLLSKYN